MRDLTQRLHTRAKSFRETPRESRQRKRTKFKCRCDMSSHCLSSCCCCCCFGAWEFNQPRQFPFHISDFCSFFWENKMSRFLPWHSFFASSLAGYNCVRGDGGGGREGRKTRRERKKEASHLYTFSWLWPRLKVQLQQGKGKRNVERGWKVIYKTPVEGAGAEWPQLNERRAGSCTHATRQGYRNRGRTARGCCPVTSSSRHISHSLSARFSRRKRQLLAIYGRNRKGYLSLRVGHR